MRILIESTILGAVALGSLACTPSRAAAHAAPPTQEPLASSPAPPLPPPAANTPPTASPGASSTDTVKPAERTTPPPRQSGRVFTTVVVDGQTTHQVQIRIKDGKAATTVDGALIPPELVKLRKGNIVDVFNPDGSVRFSFPIPGGAEINNPKAPSPKTTTNAQPPKVA